MEIASCSQAGPRYCPSIEDKVVKFSDRDSHQVFVEPEGDHCEEYYLGGFSTGLPFDAQIRMVQSLRGLEEAEIVRPAYAIEYDYFFPDQLQPTLETKACEGLYFAGQINGTSGYEEAAGQGFVAGVNAVLKMDGKGPWIPKRTESYIGVMVDDLVTKGVDEPYRLLTSRAEYRLILRNDNAHLRLSKYGHTFGLIDADFYQKLERLRETIETELGRLSSLTLKPSEQLNTLLQGKGTPPIQNTVKMVDLLRRHQVDYLDLKTFDRIDPRPRSDRTIVSNPNTTATWSRLSRRFARWKSWRICDSPPCGMETCPIWRRRPNRRWSASSPPLSGTRCVYPASTPRISRT